MAGAKDVESLLSQKACQIDRHDIAGLQFVLTILTIACLLYASSASADLVAAEYADVPDGKRNLRFGEIDIDSADIFSNKEIEQANPLLQFMQKGMNTLHISTRENVLRREILFNSGDPFDAELLSETERNLRSLGFLNNIYVTATDTTEDGLVNVSVRTRESWTLQANVAYTLAANGDVRWNASLSESNFLGLGTTLGAGVGANEVSSYWNLWYRHRRMYGSRLWFGLDYSELAPGHIKKIFISRPFFAQADSWSFDLEAWDRQLDIRSYLSHGGPAGSGSSSSASLSALLPHHEKGFEGKFLVRIKGRTEGRLWRIGGGVRIEDNHSYVGSDGNLLSDGRVVDLDFLLDEGEPLELVQGITVFPYFWLQTKGRKWTEETFVMQYGPVEDIPLGMVLNFKGGLRGGFVGSTSGCSTQLYCEVGVSRWMSWAGGMALFSGQALVSSGEGKCQSHRASLLGGWVAKSESSKAPWLTRVFAEIAHGNNLIGREVFLLGLDRGLRTLNFDGMAGNRLVRWNLEQGKATPWIPAGLFRLGGAVFYNGGLAMFDDEDRSINDVRHEIGVGLRMGPVRSSNARTGRLDISWPLNGATGVVFTATTGGTF